MNYLSPLCDWHQSYQGNTCADHKLWTASIKYACSKNKVCQLKNECDICMIHDDEKCTIHFFHGHG